MISKFYHEQLFPGSYDEFYLIGYFCIRIRADETNMNALDINLTV